MSLQQCFYAAKPSFLHPTYLNQIRSSNDRENTFTNITTQSRKSPAQEFAPLASTFRRRLLTGIASASVIALGANFAGTTSSILGFSPEVGRNLKLDVIYPIQGYSRCLDPNEGFEFIYPANWVGDQTLLYRAVGKAELSRSLDPLPLKEKSSGRRQNMSDPKVAFGPPGSNGELNVSVIVSSVPLNFSIEAFGGPKEVGETVIRTITGSGRRPDLKATLIGATMREDPIKNLNYYKLEFTVEGPSFQRHNVAICCARGGHLFTLNAQAPESAWLTVKQDFCRIADSFNLTS